MEYNANRSLFCLYCNSESSVLTFNSCHGCTRPFTKLFLVTRPCVSINRVPATISLESNSVVIRLNDTARRIILTTILELKGTSLISVSTLTIVKNNISRVTSSRPCIGVVLTFYKSHIHARPLATSEILRIVPCPDFDLTPTCIVDEGDRLWFHCHLETSEKEVTIKRRKINQAGSRNLTLPFFGIYFLGAILSTSLRRPYLYSTATITLSVKLHSARSCYFEHQLILCIFQTKAIQVLHTVNSAFALIRCHRVTSIRKDTSLIIKSTCNQFGGTIASKVVCYKGIVRRNGHKIINCTLGHYTLTPCHS